MTVEFAANLTKRTMAWTAWKVLFAEAGSHQHEVQGDQHVVWFYDGPEVYICRIWRGEVPGDVQEAGYSQEANDADKADFETNYLAKANTTIQRVTKDGRLSVRMTAAEGTGKRFRLRSMYFKTASRVLQNIHPDGTDYDDATLRCLATNGAVLTEAQLAQATCTVVDLAPRQTIEMLGGWLEFAALAALSEEWLVSVVAVPDIPAQYGGNIEFVQPTNLAVLPRVVLDGRVSALLKYDINRVTNKLRIAVQHPPGAVRAFQFCLETFQ